MRGMVQITSKDKETKKDRNYGQIEDSKDIKYTQQVDGHKLPQKGMDRF